MKAEKPLVGTGMERMLLVTPVSVKLLKRGGVSRQCDAARIVVRVNDEELKQVKLGVDIYNLTQVHAF